jgi:hypothetical protein
MNRAKRWYGILIAIVGLSFTVAQVRAQQQGQQGQYPPPPDQQQQQAPPTQPPQMQQGQQQPPMQGGQPGQQGQQQQAPQGVARISLLRGDVSTQRGDNGDWVATTLNAPVMAGDKISTSDSGSAEVELDYANSMRMSGKTEANIATLDQNYIQVQLASGLIEYVVYRGAPGSSEIDTPNMAVHPEGEASVRIQVISDMQTIVIVRRGQADISTAQGSTKLNAGQMVTVNGTAQESQYQTGPAPAQDNWDTWNEQRDRTVQGAQSWNHVNPYYTGANDLDNNGDWSEVPDYGQVWTPSNVPEDWAPYTDGTWVNEPYYGWTWVSYEPWGWAPYHYGRWFVYGGRWRWWPGPVYAGYRPVWAPAYVSFYGFGPGGYGPGFGLGFGFGSIGWLPIGPCDPFFPWFGFGFGFHFGFFGFGEWGGFHGWGPEWAHRFPGAYGPLAGRFDARFSNFNQVTHNAMMQHSLASVRADNFGHGPTSFSRGVSASELSGAHGISGSVPANVTRASFSASNRTAASSTIRSTNMSNSHFFNSRTAANSSFRGNSNSTFRGNTGGTNNSRPNFNNNTRPNSNNTRPNNATSNNGRGTSNNRFFQEQRTDGPKSAQGNSAQGQNARPQTNGAWDRTYAPNGQNNPTRGGGSQPSRPQYQGGQEYNGRQYGNQQSGGSRPPLNMSRPIINNNNRGSSGGSNRGSSNTGRSSGGSSHGSSGGSHGGGSHGGAGGHHR